MLAIALLAGAIGLELGDLSGTSAALEAEIKERLSQSLNARTKAEVVVGSCPDERCPERLRLSVDAGVSRMSWTAERVVKGVRSGTRTLTGGLQSSAELANELVQALFPEPEPAATLTTPGPARVDVSPVPLWPKVALFGAGGAALATGIVFAVQSSAAFSEANTKRDYDPGVPALLDRAYVSRGVSIGFLSAAAAAALGIGLLILTD